MKPAFDQLINKRMHEARKRLITQQALQYIGQGIGVALALCIGWLLLEPFLTLAQPMTCRYAFIGGVLTMAILTAIWRTWSAAPTALATALEIDQRFQLNERLTTAYTLPPEVLQSPIGTAVIDDSKTRVEQLNLAEKFPIQLGRRSLFIPGQLAVLALVWFFYEPTQLAMWAKGKQLPEEETAITEAKIPDGQQPPKALIKPVLERPNQFAENKELQDLKAELERLYAENQRESDKPKPEKLREKAAEIAKAEETLKKHEQMMAEKFQKLQEQLDKMTQLEKGENRQEGPAKELENALAQGDLKKAQEEADRLKKKARDKQLNQQEAEQLSKEIKQMEERVDRLNREQQQKADQLKKLIDQAKKEKRDADALERELKQLQEEMAQTKEAQKLADAMRKAKQALEQKDFEGVAEQMEELSKELGKIQEQLQDLDDIEEHLQNLKELKKKACEACELAEKNGNGQGKPGKKDNAKGFAEGASGEREENKDALTKKGEEQRIRGSFDPKGRKRYGGTTDGPAFKQQTTVEMAGEIQQAVQEAPDAIEVQKLPRAAKGMVKEYFEKLGGQTPKK